MLLNKKPINDFLSYLNTKESVTVDVKELLNLLQTRRSLDEKVEKLRKENDILIERVNVLQSIIESHNYESFDTVGKESGAVILLSKKGDTDSFWLESPFVIFDNGVYKMWYVGSNGYKWRIHYATSDDGVNWDKYGPVSILDFINVNDDIHEYDPSIIFDGTTYYMWYVAVSGDHAGIYYAISTDGINWEKHGDAIELGGAGETDELSVTNPNVIFDGTKYHMWYKGSDAMYSRIHYATSEDCLNWKKQGVVVPLGNDGESDSHHINDPFVIFDGNVFKMWYVGYNGEMWKIHYAVSKDGKNWTKRGIIPPILPKCVDGVYDIKTPCFIKDGDIYKTWFSGFVDYKWRIHYTELSESSIIK